MKYFCKYELDDENISLLLKMPASPSAQFATLAAIVDIHLINGTPMLSEDGTVVSDVGLQLALELL